MDKNILIFRSLQQSQIYSAAWGPAEDSCIHTRQFSNFCIMWNCLPAIQPSITLWHCTYITHFPVRPRPVCISSAINNTYRKTTSITARTNFPPDRSYIVVSTDFPDSLEVARWGNNNTSLSLDWLNVERSTVGVWNSFLQQWIHKSFTSITRLWRSSSMFKQMNKCMCTCTDTHTARNIL